MSTHPAATQAFEAECFHPDLPGGRGTGSIQIDTEQVRFRSQQDSEWTCELPIQDLELRLGGANDHLLFFSHPDRPEVSLFTANLAVFEHPTFAAETRLAEQVRRLRRHEQRTRWGRPAILGLAAIVIVGLLLSLGPLARMIVGWIPPSAEVNLGKVVFEQVQASTLLIEDEDLDAQLDELVAPLLTALPDAGFAFDFHLALDPTLNAFAIPGGNVVLHSGLVLEADSAEEVLGVLAHEIAHVTRRHSLRQMVDMLGVYVLVQLIFGDMTGLAAVLADGGLQLLSLEFSRDHELEADDIGFDYLQAAGVDPRGMISFFEKLQAEHARRAEEAGGSGVELTFLSTHPATEERIEALMRRLAEVDATANFREGSSNFDFEGLQEKLRRQIEADRVANDRGADDHSADAVDP